MSERPKVQHSKCCVVSQPPWVQIPALPPLPPGPIGAGRFCYALDGVCACWGLLCGAGCCLWPHGCSGRRRARPPARLGDLTSFGAAPRSPPVPSGPSGALHTSGAGSLTCCWARGSKPGQASQASRRPPIGRGPVCCPARPRRHSRAPRQVSPVPSIPVESGVLAYDWVHRLVVRPGPAAARGHRSQSLRSVRCVLLQTSSIGGVFRVDFRSVVTNVVNPTAFWLKMVVFWLRLTTFVTQAHAGRFKLRWFDDVCNVGRPSVAHSGLATTYGRRSLVLSTRWPGGLKPLSPLRAGEVGQLKPPSPLRVRKGCF